MADLWQRLKQRKRVQWALACEASDAMIDIATTMQMQTITGQGSS